MRKGAKSAPANAPLATEKKHEASMSLPPGLAEVAAYFTGLKFTVERNENEKKWLRDLLYLVTQKVVLPQIIPETPDHVTERDYIDCYMTSPSINACLVNIKIHDEFYEALQNNNMDVVKKHIRDLCFKRFAFQPKDRKAINIPFWQRIVDSAHSTKEDMVYPAITEQQITVINPQNMHLSFTGLFDEYAELFDDQFPEYKKLLQWANEYRTWRNQDSIVDTVSRWVLLNNPNSSMAKRRDAEHDYNIKRMFTRWTVIGAPPSFKPCNPDFTDEQLKRVLGTEYEHIAPWVTKVNKKSWELSKVKGTKHEDCQRFLFETRNIMFRGTKMSPLMLVDIAYHGFRYLMDPLDLESLAQDAKQTLQTMNFIHEDDQTRATEWNVDEMIERLPVDPKEYIRTAAVFKEWRTAYIEKSLKKRWHESEERKKILREQGHDSLEETFDDFKTRHDGGCVQRYCAITGVAIPIGQEKTIFTVNSKHPDYRKVLKYLEQTKVLYRESLVTVIPPKKRKLDPLPID